METEVKIAWGITYFLVTLWMFLIAWSLQQFIIEGTWWCLPLFLYLGNAWVKLAFSPN